MNPRPRSKRHVAVGTVLQPRNLTAVELLGRHLGLEAMSGMGRLAPPYICRRAEDVDTCPVAIDDLPSTNNLVALGSRRVLVHLSAPYTADTDEERHGSTRIRVSTELRQVLDDLFDIGDRPLVGHRNTI